METKRSVSRGGYDSREGSAAFWGCFVIRGIVLEVVKHILISKDIYTVQRGGRMVVRQVCVNVTVVATGVARLSLAVKLIPGLH